MKLSDLEKASWISRSNDMIKILFGWQKCKGSMYGMETQFGYHGYCMTVWTDHFDFFHDLETILEPNEIFDFQLIKRWKLINKLIETKFKHSKDIDEILVDQSISIATILSYLLLEEVARRKSNKWGIDGKLFVEIPKSFGLTRKTSKEKVEPKNYKKDDLLVLLSHKLYILKTTLSVDLQTNIENLDKAMRKSFIKGVDQELSPLFERLESNRNNWLHGREFDGWEGIFISLFLCSLYFEPLPIS